MKNLENYKVLELNKEESIMLSGGLGWLPVVGVAIAVWDAVDGFVEGMREAYKK